jgi:hypothetical protein
VATLDAEAAGRIGEAYCDSVAAMNARHIEAAMRLQEQALAHLQTDGRVLTNREALRMLELATELERLARGEPTEHVQTDGTTAAPPTSLALASLADPESARLAAELSMRVLRAAEEHERRYKEANGE